MQSRADFRSKAQEIMLFQDHQLFVFLDKLRYFMDCHFCSYNEFTGASLKYIILLFKGITV